LANKENSPDNVLIMSTRAIRYLEKKKVPFEIVKYDHEEKGAEFAARASGYPLERTVKTLVVAVTDNIRWS
jgi:prolyl-tRNA editing enzyme YbaK/EbsC (Cys-tRNA(Pro) deacylase)